MNLAGTMYHVSACEGYDDDNRGRGQNRNVSAVQATSVLATVCAHIYGLARVQRRVYGPTNRVSVRVRVWVEKSTCKYTVGGTATEIQSDYLYGTVSLLYAPSYRLYSFDFRVFKK